MAEHFCAFSNALTHLCCPYSHEPSQATLEATEIRVAVRDITLIPLPLKVIDVHRSRAISCMPHISLHCQKSLAPMQATAANQLHAALPTFLCCI